MFANTIETGFVFCICDIYTKTASDINKREQKIKEAIQCQTEWFV